MLNLLKFDILLLVNLIDLIVVMFSVLSLNDTKLKINTTDKQHFMSINTSKNHNHIPPQLNKHVHIFLYMYTTF